MPELSPSGFLGCTLSTVSHLARARVAAESWRRHHPESPFVVLLIDDDDWPADDEPFDVVLPAELDLSAEELAVQQGIYDAYELATALEPHLIRLLLDRGASAVVFTDTDTCFYGPVDDLARAATARGLVLLPTAIRPAPVHRYFPAGQVEHRRWMNGLFNSGLLAVGPKGRGFLGWWADRLARDCLKESAAGMWVDQLWLDWVPAYFEHVIVRDSALNVAFWNLDEREFGELDGRPTVDGAPLRHFHFAGFDPHRPERISVYYEEMANIYEHFRGHAMTPPPTNRALTGLLQSYARSLLECGSDELGRRPYGYSVSAGGRPLGVPERTIYREAVLAAEARGTDRPPNPFDPSRIDEFERLISDPASVSMLSPQAQRRLQRVRPSGISWSTIPRVGRRLAAASRYALIEATPEALDSPGRIESDAVRLEYGDA